jgi:hypothetical protein
MFQGKKEQGGWFCWWEMHMACLAILINDTMHYYVARNYNCILEVA